MRDETQIDTGLPVLPTPGQQLFRMYVQCSLCTDEYRWEKLSETRRKRWEELANRVRNPS